MAKCSSPGSTFCTNSYFGICSTPVLLQQHAKDPSYSAKSAGGRLQLKIHVPYVCGFEQNDTVSCCMVVWYTQNVCLDGRAFTVLYKPLQWILKMCCIKLQSLVQSCTTRAQWVCLEAENSTVQVPLYRCLEMRHLTSIYIK